MWKEFKEFAMKGNVLDLAVGVIIGGAFGKIVTSLVNDIIMPLVGILLGGVNFRDLKYVISPASGDIPESALMYGAFIQSIVDFLIVAFSIFLFVKLINSMKRKQDTADTVEEEEEVKAPTELEVLEEIRDLLKNK